LASGIAPETAIPDCFPFCQVSSFVAGGDQRGMPGEPVGMQIIDPLDHLKAGSTNCPHGEIKQPQIVGFQMDQTMADHDLTVLVEETRCRKPFAAIVLLGKGIWKSYPYFIDLTGIEIPGYGLNRSAQESDIVQPLGDCAICATPDSSALYVDPDEITPAIQLCHFDCKRT
jgi:hypothetical protein